MDSYVVKWLKYASKKWSGKIAICDGNKSITYREYHDLGVGIAQKICEKGYSEKVPIVVFMPKCLEVLVSFMGVVYSGNYYTPLDIDMPEQRLKQIIGTLKPAGIITLRKYVDNVKALGFEGDLFIYDDIEKIEYSPQVEKAADKIIENDLIYVLFTSGSTGIPKGVCVTHGGVVNFTEWITKEYEISEKDVLGNQTPFYFDMSIFDIYGAIKTGATVNIIPRKLFLQPVLLLDYIKKNEINVICWVPSAMIGISKLNAFKNVDVSRHLRLVMFAGEPMPGKQLAIWMNNCPSTIFANLYGPTECTNICTFYTINCDWDEDKPIPIGNAISNARVYVFDEDYNQVKVPNIKGELCIGGKGVSLGYYNNSEKTRSAFVQNPLNHCFDERIFKTGDIVYYNDKMELVYACRKDFQIKHKGYRIELGEIENAISSNIGISLCACLYNYKHKQIVAFVNSDVSKRIINEKISSRVPEYMLVDKVYFVDSFPINANGKIDRLKLQEIMDNDESK